MESHVASSAVSASYSCKEPRLRGSEWAPPCAKTHANGRVCKEWANSLAALLHKPNMPWKDDSLSLSLPLEEPVGGADGDHGRLSPPVPVSPCTTRACGSQSVSVCLSWAPAFSLCLFSRFGFSLVVSLEICGVSVEVKKLAAVKPH